MYYRNGREARNGDKVVHVPHYGTPVVGILYDAVAEDEFSCGRIAPTSPDDLAPDLNQCLHLDDVLKALPAEVPDTSKVSQPR